MMSFVKPVNQNRLLALMPAEARELLQPDLEPRSLPVKTVLASADKPIDYAHFILSGIASNTVKTSGGHRTETGVVGREGVSSACLILGVDRAPQDTFMQIGGSSLAIAVPQYRHRLRTCAPLREFLLRYVQVCSVQMTQTVLSNGSFSIEERTARWLLMCHDRLCSDQIPLTHEFLGVMLGVRRSGVTNAIHVLEGQEIIWGRRGVIEIRDRARLEAVAGDAYSVCEREYQRLLGSWAC